MITSMDSSEIVFFLKRKSEYSKVLLPPKPRLEPIREKPSKNVFTEQSVVLQNGKKKIIPQKKIGKN